MIDLQVKDIPMHVADALAPRRAPRRIASRAAGDGEFVAHENEHGAIEGELPAVE